MSKASGKGKSIIKIIFSLAISLSMLYSIYCSNEVNNFSNRIGDLQNEKLESIIEIYSNANLEFTTFSILMSLLKDTDKERLNFDGFDIIEDLKKPVDEQVQNTSAAYNSKIDQAEKIRYKYYIRSQLSIMVAFLLTFILFIFGKQN